MRGFKTLIPAALLVFAGLNCGPSGMRTPIMVPGTPVEKVAGGFGFAEGPAADGQGNLYFSDVTNSRIYVWTLEDSLTLFREKTGWANGLGFDREENLILCEDENRRIALLSPDGVYTVIVDGYQGREFNGPNDLWIDPAGGIYFTDPCWAGSEGMEMDGQWVFYIPPSRDRCRPVDERTRQPNGILGTPDGKTLYVSDWADKVIYQYDVQDNGSLVNRRIFSNDGADGMALDETGRIFAATARPDTGYIISVYDPSGHRLETIGVPEQPTNLQFAGDGNRTLFITTKTSLYRVKTRTRGMNAVFYREAPVPDGDFEKQTGDLLGSPWHSREGTHNNLTIDRGGESHSGNQCVHMRTLPDHWVEASQTITVEPGARYAVTAWVRGDSCEMHTGAYCYGSKKFLGWNNEEVPGNTWRQIRFEFTADSLYDFTKIYFAVKYDNGEDHVWLDTVERIRLTN